MKPLPNFLDPKFNRSVTQRLLNRWCRLSPSARPAALLAHELAGHLTNRQFFERNFYVVPDLHEYSRFFYKTLVAAHFKLLVDKLRLERATLTAAYFELYFRRVSLPAIYEDTIYRNLFFADFAGHFMDEFEHLLAILGETPAEAGLFDADLDARLRKYLFAHANYLSHLSLRDLLLSPIDYGFIRRLADAS